MPKTLVKAPLTWFWYCTKPRGIGSQPCSYLSLLGYLRKNSAVLVQQSESSHRQNLGKQSQAVTRSNSSSLLYLSTCRWRVVNDSITCKKKKKEFVAPLGIVRSSGLHTGCLGKTPGTSGSHPSGCKTAEKTEESNARLSTSLKKMDGTINKPIRRRQTDAKQRCLWQGTGWKNDKAEVNKAAYYSQRW